MEKDILFTVDELAQYLKMQPITIYKHAAAGKLPGFKVGTSWRFKKSTIDRWIEKQEDRKSVPAKNQINGLPSLYIGGLEIKIPIIQGGMGVRISREKLVSAVSNEGAMGVLSSVGLGEEDRYLQNNLDYLTRSKEALRDMIKDTKAKTQKPFGVNIMCALSNYEDLVQVCIEEKVDVIFSGAGLPLKLPNLVKGSNIKIVPIISSGRAADIIIKNWFNKYGKIADAVVVEGPQAGGHLGFSMDCLKETDLEDKHVLLNILKDVKLAVDKYNTQFKIKIPIIVGGGIFDGKDIAFYLKNGADGIQMATRFICTDECDVNMDVKNLIINSKKEDIILINSPVGMPGRVIVNDFVRRIVKGEKIPFDCKYKCLKSCAVETANYCIADALVNAYKGRLDKGFVMGGANSYRIKNIVSVKALLDELVKEAILYEKQKK